MHRLPVFSPWRLSASSSVHCTSRRASGVHRGLQSVVRTALCARRAQHWRALGVAALRCLHDGRGLELETRRGGAGAAAAASVGIKRSSRGRWRLGHRRRQRERQRHRSAAHHGLAAARLCSVAPIGGAVSRRFDRQFSRVSLQWPVCMSRALIFVLSCLRDSYTSTRVTESTCANLYILFRINSLHLYPIFAFFLLETATEVLLIDCWACGCTISIRK